MWAKAGLEAPNIGVHDAESLKGESSFSSLFSQCVRSPIIGQWTHISMALCSTITQSRLLLTKVESRELAFVMSLLSLSTSATF